MTTKARVLRAANAHEGWLGGLGVRFLISPEESGDGFALVEHPLKPRALGAPLHRHTHEDEYSVVIRGRVGAQLGDEVLYAEAGDVIFKPRGQWHTFWNAGDEEARLLELISPGHFFTYFFTYFEEMVAISGGGRPDPKLAAPIRERYELEVDPTSVPKLIAEHHLST